MPIAPTLILGLGGTGSRIVARVAEKVKESASTQANRIAYVVFDTDINELRTIREKYPAVRTVQTSTMHTVGDYLTVNTNARDNWFPVNEMLNRKTLTEGAAQVRAISRLAFDTTLKSGHLAPLHDAIDDLFRVDKDNQEQALRVIITSSLAGGTGSGLIISVAMYLANYLKSKFPHLRAITRGFFLQPDIFYDIIPGAEEQQNLQVNAYATIRELDAFLMKGDNTLPPQYRNLKFEFPSIGGEGVEAVNAMPYDFCFLFDARGTSGSLTSFDAYLDHAATCIYTQSIGPMSKRSNSSEDNTLREVIKNNGRNRYAGAGASRLVYPAHHVERYFAYTWLRTAVSRDWLKFDDAFQGQLAGVRDQQDKGFGIADLQLEKVFPDTVDTKADKEGDPFARSIKTQAVLKDPEGITEIGQKWNMYLAGLMEHLEQSIRNDADDQRKAQLSTSVAELGGDPAEYYERYIELKKFHDLVERHAQEGSAITAYSLFGSDNRGASAGQSFALETYLKNQRGDGFIHPVSARYFLYKLLDLLTKEKARADQDLQGLQGYFRDFEKQAFDDPATDEVEGPESVLARKQGFISRATNRRDGWQDDLAEKFATYLKKVGDLGNAVITTEVLREAIIYVKGLSDAFEKLFDNLRRNIGRLDHDIEKLRTYYDETKGSTTRIVYADSRSLDYIGSSVMYKGGSANADSDLAESIFSKVREYAAVRGEDKDENFFQDLYNGTIVQHFMKKFREQEGANTLEIDVIEALEREYRARFKNVEEENIRHYVVKEISAVKALAAPFIESPLGDDRHPIFACAFHPSLTGEAGSKRAVLVGEHLSNYGGQPDEEMSKQEILFYNALYGIRARDLSKFSPARVSQTENISAGEYFRAYFRLVREIRPSVEETKVITPHIDRRWHTIATLPDLDEGNQARQLAEVHHALLKGLAFGHIIREKSVGGGMIYRYKPMTGPEQDFIVSNGTPCDLFYEVVDALTIDPVAVTRLTESVDRRAEAMLSESSSGDRRSPLTKAIVAGIELTELRQIVPGLTGQAATIFDVAALWAISAPKDDFQEDHLSSMTHNFLALVRDEVFRLEDGDQRYAVLEELLTAQFDTFAHHLAAYREKGGPYFNRKLRIIIGALEDLLIDMPLPKLREAAKALDKQLLATD